MATMPDDMTITLNIDSKALKDLYTQLAHLNTRVKALEGFQTHPYYDGCGCWNCVSTRLHRRIEALEKTPVYPVDGCGCSNCRGMRMRPSTAATTPPADDPPLSLCAKCGKPIPPREAVVFYSGEKRHYHCAFTYASNVP